MRTDRGQPRDRPAQWRALRGAAAGGLVLLAACTPRTRTPAADAAAERLRQAASAVMTGRYADALRLYREAVRRDPDNALAHFELGLLLQDNRADDIAAAYHFRTYLELEPAADKAAVARERLRTAETRLGIRTGGSAATNRAVSDAQVVARLEELNAELHARDRTIATLREQNADLTRANERLGREVQNLDRRLSLMLDTAAVPPRAPSPELVRRALDPAPAPTPPPVARRTPDPEPAPPPQPVARPPATGRPPVEPIPPTVRRYRVRRGDSLWSIAQKVYGDAARSRDIRNANRGRIGRNDTLTEGDDLIIPMP